LHQKGVYLVESARKALIQREDDMEKLNINNCIGRCVKDTAGYKWIVKEIEIAEDGCLVVFHVINGQYDTVIRFLSELTIDVEEEKEKIRKSKMFHWPLPKYYAEYYK